MNEYEKTFLCLFTGGFPYEGGEAHLESEVGVLSEKFKKVFVFPPPSFPNKKIAISLPDNFQVIQVKNDWQNYRTVIFIKYLPYILKLLAQEFIHTNYKKKLLKRLREFNSIIVQRIYEAIELKKILEYNQITNSIFYTYWFSEWSTVLGILKEERCIKSFVSRAHRFDVFEEVGRDRLIPLRYFQLKNVNMVLTDSQMAADYLIENKPNFKNKIKCSYYGVFENGTNPFDDKAQFRIVSCSSLIPRKRVQLIVEILKQIDFSIEWVHFGDGELKNELLESIKSLPANVSVVFKGRISNTDVMEYYRENQINLMILVSESEGVPMSLVEACSFGIPVMTSDVGGNREIVNNQTGVLLPENVDPIETAKKIIEFRNSTKNTNEFRKGVKHFWLNNFNAEKNYELFCKEIIDYSN